MELLEPGKGRGVGLKKFDAKLNPSPLPPPAPRKNRVDDSDVTSSGKSDGGVTGDAVAALWP